jgi:hypothetical protein
VGFSVPCHALTCGGLQNFGTVVLGGKAGGLIQKEVCGLVSENDEAAY